MTDNDTPAETKAAETKAAAPEAPKRYAAYDATYLRFVGGVHATKKAAADAAKADGSKKYEIREV